MRESERRGVMERLGPAEGRAGRPGNKERAQRRGAGRERGRAGPGRRPRVGSSVCAADERAAFQLRARRAAFLAPGRAASRRGRGPRKGYICTKCLRRGPQGLRGGGRAAGEPGGEVGGGGRRPRSAPGDIRLPARRAHRFSEGTFLPPSGRRQPAEGAPWSLAPALAPQPVPPSPSQCSLGRRLAFAAPPLCLRTTRWPSPSAREGRRVAGAGPARES